MGLPGLVSGSPKRLVLPTLLGVLVRFFKPASDGGAPPGLLDVLKEATIGLHLLLLPASLLNGVKAGLLPGFGRSLLGLGVGRGWGGVSWGAWVTWGGVA